MKPDTWLTHAERLPTQRGTTRGKQLAVASLGTETLVPQVLKATIPAGITCAAQVHAHLSLSAPYAGPPAELRAGASPRGRNTAVR